MATENLKKVVVLITKTIADGENVFKDGFQFTDIFVFIPELSTIPDIIKNGPALADELNNLTAADVKDLQAFIDSSLVLQNKKTEGIVEAVLDVAVAVFNLVARIKGTAPVQGLKQPEAQLAKTPIPPPKNTQGHSGAI